MTEGPIDLSRLYEYRFREVDGSQRGAVWAEIAKFIGDILGHPDRILDPAGGRGEFINGVAAKERWFVDVVAPEPGQLDAGVRALAADVRNLDLPRDYFDGVFVSNFLEHLESPAAIGDFLRKIRRTQCSGGRIAILGPNFRYCQKQYFDCADHYVALTHVSVAEHLFAAGYDVQRVISRFLPFSFRGILPPSAFLTRAYLRMPPIWRLLGKQFLVVGSKES